VASYLGQPDAGLATYTDMVDRAEAIVDAIRKPLIADGEATSRRPHPDPVADPASGNGIRRGDLSHRRALRRQSLASVYQSLAQGKPVHDPLYPFSDFVHLIGFQQVWDFEQKYADLLAEDNI
jgi:hypothetical protein